jgi:hypothetical protein
MEKKEEREREKKNASGTDPRDVIGTEDKVQLGLQDFQEISTDMPTKYCSSRADVLWSHSRGTEYGIGSSIGRGRHWTVRASMDDTDGDIVFPFCLDDNRRRRGSRCLTTTMCGVRALIRLLKTTMYREGAIID